MLRKIPTVFYVLLFLILVGVNILIYRSLWTSRAVTVSVFEAGKGSAVLVRSPYGGTLLFNTGSDASVLRGIGRALPPWHRRLDAVVLTSSAANASGGLPAVFDRYEITNFIRFGAAGSNAIEERIEYAVAQEGKLEQTAAPYGARLTLDNSAYVDILPESLTVLYGGGSLSISSSTEKGTYTLDGVAVKKIK